MSTRTSMSIWAIGDLHLSFGTEHKEMSVFGPAWERHVDLLEASWDSSVAPNDLVLIPGDISWAMRLEEAIPDLEWIDKRPGVKVIIKGNHDYWWGSISKVRKALPPSIHALQHDVFCLNSIAIGGTRLWDSPDVDCRELIAMKEGVGIAPPEKKDEEEIFRRELNRLELSLRLIPKDAAIKIAMTHFPPIGPSLAPTMASALFEQYGVQIVAFGHLHSFKEGLGPLFGTARGVRYVLCSGDYLRFAPIRLLTV